MGRATMSRHTRTAGRKHKQGNMITPVANPSKQSKGKTLPVKTENKKKTPQCSPGQKRLRRYRAQPPQSFYEIYARATSQRFFVLDRVPGGTVESPSETIKLAGSTGNVYSVFVGSQPACDCPHGQQGNQCKHWLYIMSRVLGAKWQYVYQLGLLDSELRDIFANRPQIPGHHPVASLLSSSSKSLQDSKRKPIDGDCPICFTVLDAGKEQIVWCKAGCGQNMHKECFSMWETVRARTRVTCPYCRAEWQSESPSAADLTTLASVKTRNEEGYVNLAGELGISPHRDVSSYSPWFFRRRGWRVPPP